MPEPDAAQIIGGAIGLAQTGLGYNVNFMYPRAGGIDALPNALRDHIEARERAGEGQLRTQTLKACRLRIR